MRRVALVLVPVLLLSGCFTRLDESYVVEGATVTATPDYLLTADRCAEGEPVQLLQDPGTADEVEIEHAPTLAGSDGAFSIPFVADEQGYFSVAAECFIDEGTLVPWLLGGQALTVGPELVMAADPEGELDPGETFTVTGPFCVSQYPEFFSDDPEAVEPEFPSVSVTFEGETQVFDADEHQPFGETWSGEFTGPEVPGDYVVTATCTYDDFAGAAPPLTGEVVAAAVEESEYEPLDVVVAAPAPTPTPAPAPAPAPGAQPVAASPTFTG